jgi:hypothetical protein
MQPRQHGSGDAVAPQRDSLVDGGDAQLGRTRRQGGAPGLRRSVAVPVCLDDGHHLRRTRVLAKEGHVVRHGVKVDDGLGGRRRRRRSHRLHGHVTATDSPRPPRPIAGRDRVEPRRRQLQAA